MRDYEALFRPVFQSMGASRPLVASKNVEVSNCAELLLVQQARAEGLRKGVEGGDCVTMVELDEPSRASEPEASTVSLEDIQLGPGKLAWKLATDAKLNDDQLRPVALIADKMQQKWEACMRSAPELSDVSNECWTNYACNPERAILPLHGMLIRLLLVGGGGCGKSRIINKVLTPLIRAFYGSNGLMKEAQSNKAARNIGGETLHHANKLFGNSSLLVAHLRPKPSQKGTVNRLNRLGAKIFDEFSQIAAKMLHADAYFTTIARASGFRSRNSQ